MKTIVLALLLSSATYICHGYNRNGFIVATAFDKHEALARMLVWDKCTRHRLECAVVSCDML